MEVGLLWFDADPKRDLSEKVARAVSRFQDKFGRRPNLCYINPSTLSHGAIAHPTLSSAARNRSSSAEEAKKLSKAGSLEFDGVRLVPADNILKNHFWIGVEETASLPRAA